MALISCHECGSQISTEAKTCPHCGAKNKSRPPLVRKSLLILGVIIIGGFAYVASTIDPAYSIPECQEDAFKDQFMELYNNGPYAQQFNLHVIDIKNVKDITTGSEMIDRRCEITFELSNQEIGTHVVHYEYAEGRNGILIKGSPK